MRGRTQAAPRNARSHGEPERIRRVATQHFRAALLIALLVLGGLIGLSSAGLATATLGAVGPYESRVALGWAALGFAAVASVAGLAGRTSPVRLSALVLVCALLGGVSMSLFFLDTFYWAAVPLWLLAAVLTLANARRGVQKHQAR
jgi:hypothetical protein